MRIGVTASSGGTSGATTSPTSTAIAPLSSRLVYSTALPTTRVTAPVAVVPRATAPVAAAYALAPTAIKAPDATMAPRAVAPASASSLFVGGGSMPTIGTAIGTAMGPRGPAAIPAALRELRDPRAALSQPSALQAGFGGKAMLYAAIGLGLWLLLRKKGG